MKIENYKTVKSDDILFRVVEHTISDIIMMAPNAHTWDTKPTTVRGEVLAIGDAVKEVAVGDIILIDYLEVSHPFILDIDGRSVRVQLTDESRVMMVE